MEQAANYSLKKTVAEESRKRKLESAAASLPPAKRWPTENGLDLSPATTITKKPFSPSNKIKLCRHILREEEMKLLLLKKIFYSQLVKENLFHPLPPPAPTTAPTDKKAAPTITLQLANHKHLHNKPGLVPKSQALKEVPSYNKPAAVKPPPPPPNKPGWSQPNESQQQQQEATKMALRKQLEETLLQIPPPKPPLPDLHFIPSATQPDFILLLGLEWIVDLLVRGPSPNRVVEPFRCALCRTDFTPRWKWHKPSHSSGAAVICESCATHNCKEAVRADHTARLKSAFMKVLQQEYEMEKSFASSNLHAPKAAHGKSSVAPPPVRTSKPPATAHHHHATKVPPPPPKSHVPSTAAAMLQHHLSGRPHLLHPFFTTAHQQQQAAAVQRQMLLDMITPPSSRNSRPWKS